MPRKKRRGAAPGSKGGSRPSRPKRRPAPSATAPGSPIPTAEGGASARSKADDRLQLSRGSALPSMFEAARREKWGLPADANEPGAYMVELNLRYPEGLDEAARAFSTELYPAVMGEAAPPPEAITSAYFRGHFTVAQWVAIVRLDEQWELERKR